VILEFKRIEVYFPQKKLQKEFEKSTPLATADRLKLSALLLEIEQAQNRLAHLRSIVEKILNRSI